MPRKRKKENIGLPARWCYRHGAYYYQVPPGLEHLWDGKKLFRLGKTLPEAYRIWSDRIGSMDTARTLAEVFDRYAAQVIPTKAPATQTVNAREIKRLRAVFGHRKIHVAPQEVYQYMDKRKAKSRGRKEIALLSHVFTKAVEWGYIRQHPFKGEVRLAGASPRDRYVEDWEIIEALNLPAKRKKGSVLMLQAYARIKLLTGMARGDLLRMRPAEQFKEDGIHIQRHKTAKRTNMKTIYTWTDELHKAVQMALDARPVDISPFLFCTKNGEGYIDERTGEASGFDSLWARFMGRLLKETDIEERFTEHDLRAKVGSDADSDERARQLLSHASVATTRRAYRRKAEIVTPTR